jgi:hypothetical protein
MSAYPGNVGLIGSVFTAEENAPESSAITFSGTFRHFVKPPGAQAWVREYRRAWDRFGMSIGVEPG